MAWDNKHVTTNSNGGQDFKLGYLSETITLGNDADASTSHIPYPIKSDATVLVMIEDTFASNAETYIQVEHSWDGVTYVKQGQFEIDSSIDGNDISQDMSKIGYIDSDVVTETEGLMMLFDIDSHGKGTYSRITVKANGQDESSNHATFYIFPHF